MNIQATDQWNVFEIHKADWDLTSRIYRESMAIPPWTDPTLSEYMKIPQNLIKKDNQEIKCTRDLQVLYNG